MIKEALTDNVLNNEESSFKLLNINYAILSEETVPNPGLKVTAGQNQHEFQIKPGGFYFSKVLFEGLIFGGAYNYSEGLIYGGKFGFQNRLG